MSRTSQIMNRIELAAKKFKMDIEQLIDILEGKHPTHEIVVKPVEAQTGNATTTAQTGPVATPTPTPPPLAANNVAADTQVSGTASATSATIPAASAVADTDAALENEENAAGNNAGN